MKIHPVEAEFFPCGRTDMTKLIVAFRDFASAPNYSADITATCSGMIISPSGNTESNVCTIMCIDIVQLVGLINEYIDPKCTK